MSTVIDKEKLRKIVRGSYKEIRKYEQKITSSKQQTVGNITSLIEKEFKNEDKQD